MPTLTILIKEMFLYVHRDNEPDLVLLPSGEGDARHHASISGLGVDEELDGAEVSFVTRANGATSPLPGSARRGRPTEPHLPDLRDVLGSNVVVPKGFMSGKITPSLNARVFLPNGDTTAFKAMNKKARSVKWDFKTLKNPNHGPKGVELTDIIQTTVPVSPLDSPYVQIERRNKSVTLKPLVSDGAGNYLVVIQNSDNMECDGDLQEKEYTLYQYRLLYALTDAVLTEFPFPVGTYGTPKKDQLEPQSLCLPICGGAGCPGEP